MPKSATRSLAKQRTIEQLVDELRQKFRATAKEYVPQIEAAVKTKYPKLSKIEQRWKVNEIAQEFWSQETIRQFISSSLKDQHQSALAKKGHTDRLLKQEIAFSSARVATALNTQKEPEEEEDSRRSPISLEQERKHDDAVDNQYHYLRSLIELLSGVDYVKERDSNLALVDKTKDHRFKLVKQLSDLDVKAIYTDGRTLAHILNDYLKLLDNELDVRQAKEKLVSE